MILLITILTIIYILSILGCRYYYRYNYKNNIWLSKDCQMDLFWFIPIFNTIGSIIGILQMFNNYIQSKTSNNKFINKLLNRDLK